MAGRTDFSDEEWNLLQVAPILVASRLSISDLSGLIRTLIEDCYGMSSNDRHILWLCKFPGISPKTMPVLRFELWRSC